MHLKRNNQLVHLSELGALRCRSLWRQPAQNSSILINATLHRGDKVTTPTNEQDDKD